jgi:hypothetical protein
MSHWGFCLDPGKLGSNANVADGGIRKGTRSDEIRPIIRPWPLPPLRPRRAASVVAGLRYGSGQGQDKPWSNIGSVSRQPQLEPIPLIIYR